MQLTPELAGFIQQAMSYRVSMTESCCKPGITQSQSEPKALRVADFRFKAVEAGGQQDQLIPVI
ncbi:hypothetical protein LP7551_03056 [Roseibium album]|nr:hypothetical protein LP7551_03056 [Roseibium album]